MIAVKESSTGVMFAVKVHPRARKNKITGVVGNTVKLSLTAPPLEGRANQAMVSFFAKLFEIPRSSVTITSGANSRNKIVRLSGIDPEHVGAVLAAAGIK